jgi:hypothetical protein
MFMEILEEKPTLPGKPFRPRDLAVYIIPSAMVSARDIL